MNDASLANDQLPLTRRWKKWAAILMGLFGILLLAAWGWFAYLRSHGNREVIKAIAAIDRVDPGWRLEDLESARVVVPDHENSAPVVVAANNLIPEAWAQVAPPDYPPTKEYSPPDERLLLLLPVTPLDDALANEIRAELNKVPEALAQARKLAGLPKGRHKIAWTVDHVSTTVIDQQGSRNVARLLQLDAALLAHEGKCDRALAACRAALNAGRSIGDEPLLISVLIRIACDRIALFACERTVAQGESSASELAKMQKLVEDEAEPSLELMALRGERAGQFRLMEALKSGKVNLSALTGGQQSLAETWMRPHYAHCQAFMLRKMTELIDIAQLPPDRQAASLQAFNAELQAAKNSYRKWQLLPTLMMMPAIDKTIPHCQETRARLRCALAALAAERYRLMNQRWPTSLGDLVPDQLKNVPLDLDGKPLRFKQLPDGILVYSIGRDLKDNGGLLNRSAPSQAGFDLGFRLWDPKHRRQVSRLPRK